MSALAHAKAISHDVEELVVGAIGAFELVYETDAHQDAVVTEPGSCDLAAAGGVPVVFVGLVALEVDQLRAIAESVRSDHPEWDECEPVDLASWIECVGVPTWDRADPEPDDEPAAEVAGDSRYRSKPFSEVPYRRYCCHRT